MTRATIVARATALIAGNCYLVVRMAEFPFQEPPPGLQMLPAVAVLLLASGSGVFGGYRMLQLQDSEAPTAERGIRYWERHALGTLAVAIVATAMVFLFHRSTGAS